MSHAQLPLPRIITVANPSFVPRIHEKAAELMCKFKDVDLERVASVAIRLVFNDYRLEIGRITAEQHEGYAKQCMGGLEQKGPIRGNFAPLRRNDE